MKSWITPASSRSKREGRLLFVQVLPQADITGMVTVVEAVKITSLNRDTVYHRHDLK